MAPRFRFGPFVLEPARPSLRCGDEEVHLRPKTFQVLVYLVEQRHRFVSKQELWDTVWEGSAVTDDSLVQCVTDIRRALADDSKNPQYIRTLPRVGYRFVAPVDIQDAAPVPRFGYAAAAAVLILVAVFGLFAFRSRRVSPALPTVSGAPGRPSVMVMYLENKSSSPDLDWLRQGLADMLISGLTRSDRFTVVGRQQLDSLIERNGAAVPVKLDRALALALEMHVDKLVLGTFGRLGDRLRVDVQLYDTKTSTLAGSEALVADRAEQILTEIDGLSVRLASRLGSEGRPQHPLTEVMTDDLEAYRFYSLGVEKVNALHAPEAIALLTKATALDPNFAMAHARIGYAYATWDRQGEGKAYLQKAFSLSDRLTPKDRSSIGAWYAMANYDYAEAIRIYRRLIDAYPQDVENYLNLTKILYGTRQLDEAIGVARAGLSIDPHALVLHNRLANIYADLRDYEHALEHARRYVELAPEESNAYDTLGLVWSAIGRYDEAERQFSRAIATKPGWEVPIIHLGNTYFREGRYRDAQREYQRYVDGAPSSLETRRGLEALAFVAETLGRHAEADRLGARVRTLNPPVLPWIPFKRALERRDAALLAAEQHEIDHAANTNRGGPGNERWRFYRLGLIAGASGKSDAALELFRRTVAQPAVTWDLEDYETCLADALVEQRRYADAIPEYERILRLNPNQAMARYGLARAYDAAGKTDSAIRQYVKFLDSWQKADRDIPLITEAQRRLASLTDPGRAITD